MRASTTVGQLLHPTTSADNHAKNFADGATHQSMQRSQESRLVDQPGLVYHSVMARVFTLAMIFELRSRLSVASPLPSKHVALSWLETPARSYRYTERLKTRISSFSLPQRVSDNVRLFELQSSGKVDQPQL